MYWSRNKIRMIEKSYHNTNDKELAKMIGTSESMVRRKAKELGLEKGSIVENSIVNNEWTDSEINYLTTVYANTPNRVIAHKLDRPLFEVEHFAYRFGLKKSKEYFSNIIVPPEERDLLKEWELSYDKSSGVSKGHFMVGKVLRHIFPNYRMEEEHYLDGLRLDWYVMDMKLCAEFHGQQHFQFNSHFYETKADFRRAQERDYRKSELCEERGIALIHVDYDEDLSVSLVRRKIDEVI